MIEIRGLTKTFKSQKVLDGLDLDIVAGKITIVMGPTGTGKSVLLKHVLGLLKPDSGSILVEGRDIVAMDEAELTEVRKAYGVCFQDSALFDSMTVGENVGFPFTIHTKLSREEIMREVSTLLREVGLAGIEAKMPAQLSGGMRKRVGLARALALSPKVLLFDEPTTGLDPVMTTAINTLIRQVQQKTGATSLVISHDIKGAFSLADYMALLYNGKIAFYGTPEDFRNTDDELVRQFVEGKLTGPINPIQ
ncbi:MAG TPA: ABC transporter ATP-binding protein [Deltaproteobacteria bacterium]|nr:ABC transporter ATP-binding protein [Deltaproteobacteria bacterium]HOM28441.1 ABC transporter ATP-binding protein [Deltaproteobacteria bacterium]HPP79682.1 ABC transporter ATP-binding protein [Deltaproteobacteria bacterium]